MAEIGEYQGMHYGFMQGMRAVTKQEALQLEHHGVSGPMNGSKGIAFVRVEAQSDKHWVVVDCSSLEPIVCPRHGSDFKQLMSIEKTKDSTHYNLRKAAFYKCNYDIELEDGSIGRCGFNIYPVMPRLELEDQWSISENNGRGPLMIVIRQD